MTFETHFVHLMRSSNVDESIFEYPAVIFSSCRLSHPTRAMRLSDVDETYLTSLLFFVYHCRPPSRKIRVAVSAPAIQHPVLELPALHPGLVKSPRTLGHNYFLVCPITFDCAILMFNSYLPTISRNVWLFLSSWMTWKSRSSMLTSRSTRV